MTEEEFRTIQVGDVLTYREQELKVIQVERFTDYSKWDAVKGEGETSIYTWKCHFDNGTNAQINDDIRGLQFKRRKE